MTEPLKRYFSPDRWFRLPLSFRREWWKETDYGQQSPSQELLDRAAKYLDE